MCKIKVLVLLSVFAVISVATVSADRRSNQLKVKNLLQNLQLSDRDSKVLGKYQGLMHYAGEYEEEPKALNNRNFRLPNNTEPVSYDIRLSTDIHRGDFGFQGEVTIVIRALEATNSITLHSRQTIIERIDLFAPNGTLVQGNVPFTYDSEVEFLVIPVDNGLDAGEELSIDISYQGFLRSELMGFFRTSYYNPETDQDIWLATTQFQPINARQAFPCYDEVRYRRPIRLQIRHNRHYNAISNMPVSEQIENGEYITTVFEETPPIPVFVLAFTVSDFDFVELSNSDVDLRVYARPSAISAGQADDGLRLGEVMLRAIENLFGVSYTLPKSDQVAIPSFASDGALNWGLITHREDVILQQGNDTSAQRRRQFRVAHEYAHIFFANLIAPSSWAYLWLNEGISTLYEVVLNTVYLGENQWQIFLMEYFDVAIALDVSGLVPALNNYVESPQEIRAKFDFVTYNKGAIIARMFGEVTSTDIWIQAMIYYINEKQMESASPQDVYNSVQRAYDEENPMNNLNFTLLMSPWFDFAGFPVVTVSRSDEGILITQEGFKTLHNEIFPIPINFASASVPNFNDTAAGFWMITGQLTIYRQNIYRSFTDEDWIIFNIRDTAYYITNYDDNLWNLIIDALNNDHDVIHFLNRGTLFADFHRFIAQDYNVSMVYFLRMMESLPLEFEPHVWSRAALGLALAEVRLRNTEFANDYIDFVREIMSEIYGDRSFEDRHAMDVINHWSCWSGVQECLDDALNVLVEVMENGNTDFEFDYQCNGLRSASQSIWTEFYYSIVDSTSDEDRSTALQDLFCTGNEELLRFYLNQALNTTNSLSASERGIILTTAAVQSETSNYLMIEFIAQNHETINDITSVSTATLILQMAIVANNYIQAETVMSLVQYASDDEITEEMIVEIVQPNLNFIYRNAEALTEWFNERS
ncbi:hypothetical protein HA402_011901 [Bradysia odoriphaga]|nr:hypothetical protein HA402_011901 [Bradysia odoriphaga]